MESGTGGDPQRLQELAMSDAHTSEALPVPPLNLAGQFAELQEALLAELSEVATSGYYVLGPKVTAFEEALVQYTGAKHALGLSSGTDALLVAMMALNIAPSDEVLVPAFTFFGTAGTVARLGARPVFCDIEPDTYNMDPQDMERRITQHTEAILPVHLYGQMADMTAIMAIAEKHDRPVIEDAAQAIGARDAEDRAAGTIGLFGALSFYPTKNLGAMGDAGALLTSDAEMLEVIRKLRIHGSGHTYFHEIIGGNFRIDALQAAILTIKLRQLEAWTDRRREKAQRYTQLIAEAGLSPEFVRTPEEKNGRHVYHQYVLRATQRDALVEHMRARKVGVGVYYPLALHLQECFSELGYRAGDFPVAEQASQEVMALPIYPELTEEQQAAVVEGLVAFYKK
jgi:dTDP-4-amino-4,6-dideoxygalactose transaminase